MARKKPEVIPKSVLNIKLEQAKILLKKLFRSVLGKTLQPFGCLSGKIQIHQFSAD